MERLTKPSTWTPPESIPMYNELSRYRWLEDFIQAEETEQKIKKLQAEEQQLLDLPVRREDFMSRLKANLTELEKERIAAFGQFCIDHWNEERPLAYFQEALKSPYMAAARPLPSFSDFEAAVNALPVESPNISIRELESKLKKIRDELVDLRTNLIKLRGEKALFASKRTFVENWKNLQMQTTGPVGPFGVRLNKSNDAEINAWEILGLGKLVNDRGRFLPHEGA